MKLIIRMLFYYEKKKKERQDYKKMKNEKYFCFIRMDFTIFNSYDLFFYDRIR